MPKVVWTPENDRKLLIRLIERSAKAYDTVELAKLFAGEYLHFLSPSATPKAIEERIAKLKREAKAAASGKEAVSSATTGVEPGANNKPKRKRNGENNREGGKRKKRSHESRSSKHKQVPEMEDDEEVGVVKNEEGEVKVDPDETEEEAEEGEGRSEYSNKV